MSWSEIYRPRRFEDLKFLSANVEPLRQMAQQKSIPHLLFSGPPGTSKTSIALVLMRELYSAKYEHRMMIHLNASDERGIDVVRQTIKTFASTRPLIHAEGLGICAHRTVILDEADQMTRDAQMALRRIIEDNSAQTRFIIICNQLEDISSALQSRCIKLRFRKVPHALTMGVLQEVARKENLTDIDLNAVADFCDGDLRSAVNSLQQVAAANIKEAHLVLGKAPTALTWQFDNLDQASKYVKDRCFALGVFECLTEIFKELLKGQNFEETQLDWAFQTLACAERHAKHDRPELTILVLSSMMYGLTR